MSAVRVEASTFAALLLSLSAFSACAATDSVDIVVSHDLTIARPAETIVVPFADVKARLPGIVFDQIVVRDARGRLVPSQVTSFVHSHKGPQEYNDLIFQHDFAVGEKSARFTIQKTATATPPYASKIYIRYVPERYDDFAWENDRLAHRAYGPALELASAGKDQMTSSGLDIWSKEVRYSIIDHWYHKGHDGLHTDTGEGCDMYETGVNRGAGGIGIWDGKHLAVSKNYRTWRILANGPVRGVFELGYEPWDRGDGVMVREVKRVTVDAGQNLDAIESLFEVTTPGHEHDALTVAIGISKHTTIAAVAETRDEQQHAISLWESYKDERDGRLGSAIMLDASADFAGFAEVPGDPNNNRAVRDDALLLATVKAGEKVRYFAGAGWDKSGDFKSRTEWDTYLAQYRARAAAPVKVTFAAVKP
jgi:Domain of unknown function (DUF4861)